MTAFHHTHCQKIYVKQLGIFIDCKTWQPMVKNKTIQKNTFNYLFVYFQDKNKTKPWIIVWVFFFLSYTFLLLQKIAHKKYISYVYDYNLKKIYSIIKVTDRTTILQIIIWFCKWYHDLMFFNSLYKIVVSIYTKLSRCIKTYSIMIYQIPKKKHESYKVCLVWLHWKLILWKGLSWTHYSKLYFALAETKAWIL